MTRKWSNQNLPGALHFLTGNLNHRVSVFTRDSCCRAFLEICASLRETWPCKLIAYVLMPDHFHMILNPRDGRIKEFAGTLKSLSARRIIELMPEHHFTRRKANADGSIHQVWQESFKDLALWSGWMIWQKINYIHNNPLKAKLVKSAKDYLWSSFRPFYFDESEPLAVDKDWWWPDDVEKLKRAIKELASVEKGKNKG